MHDDSSTVTREVPAAGSFTPRTLAAFIATLVRTDPSWWYQGLWYSNNNAGSSRIDHLLEELRAGAHSCGTTACVAGWAGILTAPAGARLRLDGSLMSRYDRYLGHVSVLGAEALELDEKQAGYLFSALRTRNEVLAALDAIAESGTFEVPEYED